MLNLLDIIKRSTDFLQKHGVESPRLNAELLIGHALGLKRMQLYIQFERPLTEPELEKIRPMLKRRSTREPLQYILGTAEFCGLTLKVDRRALIPRPETELLVETVIQKLAAPPATILDLGTGTGAIALALAQKYAEAAVTGVDASADALALARENAATLALGERLRWLECDWFAAVPASETFALIISNPPYLSDAETKETQPEVREFEPWKALSAGPQGEAALVHLLTAARERLAPGGLLALETGIAQHAQLTALARERGYAWVESKPDLTGRDRFILAGG